MCQGKPAYVLVAPTDFSGFLKALNDRFVPVK